MKNHLYEVIDIWVEMYQPQVSKAEVNALKDTIYSTVYQYIKDNNNDRRKWNDK